MTTTTQQQLTGFELINFQFINKDLTKQEQVKGAGYYTIKEDGSIRYNYTEFYTALIEAKSGVVQTGECSHEPSKTERVVTGEDVTYTIHVPVQTFITITVEGKDGLTRDEILNSVTREDLSNAEGEIQWDDVKEGFKDGNQDEFYIELEDSEGDVEEID